MKQISADQLDAGVLDQIDPDGVTIVRDGKAVARLLPVCETMPAALIGSMRGVLKIQGDVMTTGIAWHAQS